MTFSRHAGLLSVAAVTISLPVPAYPQVIAQLNEQAAGSAFEEIASGSFTQFVDDRFVAFAGGELAGPYDGLWLRDVSAPRGAIHKLGVRPPDVWAISPDKRSVAFVSDSKDLVSDKSNVCWHSVGLDRYALQACNDLYIRDLATGSVTRIHGPEGREVAADSGAGRFSPDGRWIAYVRRLATAPGSQPSHVLLHDRERGTATIVSGALFAHSPSVSRNGTRVTFFALPDSGTDASRPAIMVYDRDTGLTERVDVDLPSRIETTVSTAIISADGRYVAFEGFCRTCGQFGSSQVVIRDLLWRRTFQAVYAIDGSDPNSGVSLRGLSHDGRFVLLESASSNLVENDPSFGDVFVLDRVTNAMVRVSQGVDGPQPNGVSFGPAMDSHTLYVSFASQATNLLPHAVSPSVNLFLSSLDLDSDGLHDSWERFFDGSPLLTGPSFDDDGDGLANLQEFERGTHPRGRYGLSLAISPEPSNWGIKLHNQTSRPATAIVRFVDQSGHAASRAFMVPAQASIPIRLGDIPDRPPAPFILEIESDEPLFGLTRR